MRLHRRELTAEFGQFIAEEIDKWATVIKAANIRVN
jgi:hypothetical protein